MIILKTDKYRDVSIVMNTIYHEQDTINTETAIKRKEKIKRKPMQECAKRNTAKPTFKKEQADAFRINKVMLKVFSSCSEFSLSPIKKNI